MIAFFAIAMAIGTIRTNARTLAVFAVSGIVAAIIIALPSAQGNIGLERALSIGDQFQAGRTTTDIEGGLAVGLISGNLR